MAKATPATALLAKAGIAFTLHEYDYDPNAPRIGLQAAQALGIAPERLLKTLMAKAGGAVVCVLVPSDKEVSLKRLALAAGAKEAAMLPPAEAEREVERPGQAEEGDRHHVQKEVSLPGSEGVIERPADAAHEENRQAGN
jgi:hypothetical protein